MTLTANGIPANGNYTWSNTATTNTITVSPSVTTLYTVTITDANNCSATDVVQVTVNEIDFGIPNFFTPNGDGTNDSFGIVTMGGVVVTKMQVFNRWGVLVFDNPNKNWNGTYEGELQPMDTYVYVITVKFPDGKETTKVGDVFLIR